MIKREHLIVNAFILCSFCQREKYTEHVPLMLYNFDYVILSNTLIIICSFIYLKYLTLSEKQIKILLNVYKLFDTIIFVVIFKTPLLNLGYEKSNLK